MSAISSRFCSITRSQGSCARFGPGNEAGSLISRYFATSAPPIATGFVARTERTRNQATTCSTVSAAPGGVSQRYQANPTALRSISPPSSWLRTRIRLVAPSLGLEPSLGVVIVDDLNPRGRRTDQCLLYGGSLHQASGRARFLSTVSSKTRGAQCGW